MPVSLDDIVVLRKKLELDRKRLQQREEAVAVVEQMLKEDAAKQVNGSEHVASSRFERKGTPIRNAGFAQSVRNAVAHFGTESFTGPEIETLLRSQGTELPKVNPRSRISVVLEKFRKGGIVVFKTKGKGSKPHRYKAIQQEKK